MKTRLLFAIAIGSLLITAYIDCGPERPPKKFMIKTVKHYFDDADNQKEFCGKCPPGDAYRKGITGIRYDSLKSWSTENTSQA